METITAQSRHKRRFVSGAPRFGAASLPPTMDMTAANLPLGILPKVKYDTNNIPMQPGDRICLYTDGLTDCAGPDDEPFGEAGLADSLARNAGLSPSSLKAAILGDLKRHLCDRLPDDDVTLLIAEIS